MDTLKEHRAKRVAERQEYMEILAEIDPAWGSFRKVLEAALNQKLNDTSLSDSQALGAIKQIHLLLNAPESLRMRITEIDEELSRKAEIPSYDPIL